MAYITCNLPFGQNYFVPVIEALTHQHSLLSVGRPGPQIWLVKACMFTYLGIYHKIFSCGNKPPIIAKSCA